jgi:hypothetical protein
LDGIRNSLFGLKQKVSHTLKTVKEDGISSILAPLKEKLKYWLSKKEAVKKSESKLWQAAFGLTKQEFIDTTAEDFRRYMILGHFNMGNVK